MSDTTEKKTFDDEKHRKFVESTLEKHKAQITYNKNGTVTFRLNYPIETKGGEPVTEIMFRRIKSKDTRLAMKNKDTAEAADRLLRDTTGLSAEVLAELDAVDELICSAILGKLQLEVTGAS